jgi:hypothetical protein
MKKLIALVIIRFGRWRIPRVSLLVTENDRPSATLRVERRTLAYDAARRGIEAARASAERPSSLSSRFAVVITPARCVPRVVASQTAKFFVTLFLGDIDSCVVAEDVPPRTIPLESSSEELSPLLQRLDPDSRRVLFGVNE